MSEEVEAKPNLNENGNANEDDSLDSFFKKKDKKGKKKKGKKSETGSSDKPSSKGKKKEIDSKKDSEATREDGTAKDQEEWIEYEDDSERDYSDLKIQNLQINDNLIDQNSPDQEYNEAGELIPPKPADGPWKIKTTTAPKQQHTVAEAPQPEPPKKVGAYRPPQARGGSGGNLAPSALPKRNRKQQAPQLNNELDFPSLNNVVTAVPEPKGFEAVKHGGKAGSWQMQQQRNAKASELRLDNQFSALNSGV